MAEILQEIKEFKELGLIDCTKRDFEFLVKTEEDLKEFLSFYWEGVDRQFYSVSRYREKKIKENHIEFEDFKKLYMVDKIRALEKIFQHPVNYEVIKLEEMIREGTISLKKLYYLHCKYKKRRLLRLLLSTTLSDSKLFGN